MHTACIPYQIPLLFNSDDIDFHYARNSPPSILLGIILATTSPDHAIGRTLQSSLNNPLAHLPFPLLLLATMWRDRTNLYASPGSSCSSVRRRY